ncbi:Skt5/Shc1 [Kluyveromyces lactis]|nr:Skt5/Shc1 [Kluyveromyces lactis]
MAASASHAHPYAQHLAELNPMVVDIPELEVSGNVSSADFKADDEEPRALSGLSSPSFTVTGEKYANLRSNNNTPPNEKPEYIRQHKRSESSNGNMSVNSIPSSGSRGSDRRVKSVVSFSSNAENPNRRSRSVDLSHLYLGGERDIRFTSTNELVADESHKRISTYLGNDSAASLLSRQKTIEMYKQNVKKSKNPDVLFQYSQYMLQTALTMNPTEFDDKKNEDGLTVEEQRLQFLKEALHYLKKLSVKGYKDAQYLLADSYSSGVFGKVNQKEAFSLFQASAKHGHVEAAYRTSVCFEEGIGTTRDSRKCIEFLKFAASRNHPAAMFKLGVYAFYAKMGLSDDLNTKKNGLKWLSRAAAKANRLTCAAPYEMAKIYDTGFLDILIADRKYAMELYIQAASLGHMPSATHLGKIYEVGNEVVPQDTLLSVNYYTIASHGGDPEAMMGLCAWYLIGAKPAFVADDKEAFEWALRAAKLGYPKAQFTVGYFYEKGKGCEPNTENAMKWYQLAADNKDPRALNKLKIKDRSSRKSKSLSTFNFNFLLDNNEEKGKRKSFHLNLDQDDKPATFVDMEQNLTDPSKKNKRSNSIPVEQLLHPQQETPSTSSASLQKLSAMEHQNTPSASGQKSLHDQDVEKTPNLRSLSDPKLNKSSIPQTKPTLEENENNGIDSIKKNLKTKSKRKNGEKTKKGCVIM